MSSNNEVQYIVKVNGVAITAPTTKELAEQQKMGLPEASKVLAEVVPVTNDGKQILFE